MASATQKTTFYLPADLLAQVHAHSARTGQPASEIYRRALREYVGRNQPTPADALRFAVADQDRFEVTAQLTLDDEDGFDDPFIHVSFDDGRIVKLDVETFGAGFAPSLDILDRCVLTGVIGYALCPCGADSTIDKATVALSDALSEDAFQEVVGQIFKALKQKLTPARRVKAGATR
jgi:hypothetical protein